MIDGRLLLISDYAGAGGADMGGAGIAVLESFQALRAFGARARLISGLPAVGALANDPDVTGLSGTDLRSGSRAKALKTVYNPASRRALAKALQPYSPASTIVVLHQWTRYLTPSALGLLSAYPTMIYMHDYFWACPNGAYFDFQRGDPCHRRPGGPACITATCDKESYAHKLVRLVRHGALSVATAGMERDRVHLHISKKARDLGETLLPRGRHAVVYNPISVDCAAPGQPPPLPAYDVGYFGRLEPEKGIARLLDELPARGMTALFVGDGSLADRVDRTPGMTRMPWQPKGLIASLMKQCRVVALPSLWTETWGLITAEAMALGVSVLVSSRAGSSELVKEFGGGLVFDPGLDGDLGRALDLVRASGLGDYRLTPALRDAMLSKLSPEGHARRIVEVAREVWGIDVGWAPDQSLPVGGTSSLMAATS